MRWYINRSGRAEGPYDEAAVLDGARSGAVPRGALVCPEGGSEWIAVERLPAFLAALPPAPSVKKYDLAGYKFTRNDLIVIGGLSLLGLVGFGVSIGLGTQSKEARQQEILGGTAKSASPARPSTTVPQAPAKPGIGITRAKLQADYESEGFAFEPSSAVRGEPRFVGKSGDGLAYIELIGDPRELTIATLMLGVTEETTLSGTKHAVQFFNRVAPEWEGAVAWYVKALKKSPAESEHTHGSKRFSVQPLPSTSMVVISVRREEKRSDWAGAPGHQGWLAALPHVLDVFIDSASTTVAARSGSP